MEFQTTKLHIFFRHKIACKLKNMFVYMLCVPVCVRESTRAAYQLYIPVPMPKGEVAEFLYKLLKHHMN